MKIRTATAWLVKIKLSAPDEVSKLLSAADYQSYVGAEAGTSGLNVTLRYLPKSDLERREMLDPHRRRFRSKICSAHLPDDVRLEAAR